MINLNEYRGLRNYYGKKTAVALAKRFHAETPAFWQELIDHCKIIPFGDLDGLILYADILDDMADWAALTRFVWLANLVWEMECEELAARSTTWGAKEYAARHQTAA
jgi:hypothetical protein